MLKKLFIILFFTSLSSNAIAGRECGAKGDWRSGLVPDTWGKAKFYKACIKHDDCYSTIGKSRPQCDHSFKGSMFKECERAYGWAHAVSGCRPAAVSYYEGVVAYGAPYYERAQNEAKESAEELLAELDSQ